MQPHESPLALNSESSYRHRPLLPVLSTHIRKLAQAFPPWRLLLLHPHAQALRPETKEESGD